MVTFGQLQVIQPHLPAEAEAPRILGVLSDRYPSDINCRVFGD